MQNVNYTAAFVSERNMRQLQYIAAKHGQRLAKTPARPHITLAYRPAEGQIHEELFGKKIVCRLIRYGNDGLNEGFYVAFDGGDKRLVELFSSITTPHITLSFAEESKPVKTGFLDFKPLATVDQLVFEAEFGAFYGCKR